jgi:hypothetical protein
MISPEGTYTINGLPAGDVKILVNSDNPKPPDTAVAAARGGRGTPGEKKPTAPGGAEESPVVVPDEVVKAWFPIPEKYADIAKSPLKTTVNKGPNIYDIILD